MKFLLPTLTAFLFFVSFSSAYAQDVVAQSDTQQAQDAQGSPEVKSFFSATEEEGTAPPSAEDQAVASRFFDPKAAEQDALDPISGTVPLSDVPFYDLYERRIRYKKVDKEFRDSIELRRASFEKPSSDKLRAAEEKTNLIYQEENKRALEQQQNPDQAPDDAALDSSGVDKIDVTMPAKPEDNRPKVALGKPGDGMEGAPEKLKEQEKVTEAMPEQKKEEPKTDVKPTVAEASAAPTAPVDAAKQAPAVVDAPKGPELLPETPKTGIKEIDVQETPQVGEPEKKVIVPADAPDFEKSPL